MEHAGDKETAYESNRERDVGTRMEPPHEQIHQGVPKDAVRNVQGIADVRELCERKARCPDKLLPEHVAAREQGERLSIAKSLLDGDLVGIEPKRAR